MNEYLALGNALHLGLELAYKDGGIFSGSKAAEIFSAEFKRIIDEDEIFIGYPKARKMEADGLNMLALYASMVDKGQIAEKPLAHEVEFKIPYKNTTVVGRIDKVEFDPAIGYHVIDYKSGSKEPDLWFLRHNLQLTAYAWACQELYGELPKKLIWHQLRSGKLLETERTQQDIDDLKQMISNALFMDKHDIRHRIFHEQICNWCDYSGAICDDRELEARIVSERKARRKNSKGADSD